MQDNPTEEELRKAEEIFGNNLKKAFSGLDEVFKTVTPGGMTKPINFEIEPAKEKVIRRGFLGFFRKVETTPARAVKVTAYIAMNNILCFDFTDKAEMRKYFDELK